MNRDIKVLCRIAGIDQEERITTYRGNERIDEIKKKYELVGTIKASEMSKMNMPSRLSRKSPETFGEICLQWQNRFFGNMSLISSKATISRNMSNLDNHKLECRLLIR